MRTSPEIRQPARRRWLAGLGGIMGIFALTGCMTGAGVDDTVQAQEVLVDVQGDTERQIVIETDMDRHVWDTLSGRDDHTIYEVTSALTAECQAFPDGTAQRVLVSGQRLQPIDLYYNDPGVANYGTSVFSSPSFGKSKDCETALEQLDEDLFYRFIAEAATGQTTEVHDYTSTQNRMIDQATYLGL